MKRKLAATLAADVAGYSRLMGADEEATADALRASREVADKRLVPPARGALLAKMHAHFVLLGALRPLAGEAASLARVLRKRISGNSCAEADAA